MTYRLIEKLHIEPGGELATRLAAVVGPGRQDGVLLDLWPAIFLDEDTAEHVHVLQDRNLCFVTRYIGDPRRETRLLRGVLDHCAQHALALCYLDMSNRRKLEIEQECGLLSVPVGVVQTIDDTRTYSLAGSKMKRLRYMVERFKRAGDTKVVEYTQPVPETDSQIRAVMLRLEREKGVVNKVDAILRELKAGQLLMRYRVYLTYLNDELQNVHILTVQDGTCLMDQEYYLPNMPLGGTEYAVTEAIKLLAPQGCHKFSLGLTWGLFVPEEGFSDQEGWALINQSEGQLAQIFQRGAKNHQYKNKFSPSEYPLYLYRAATSRPQIIKQCMGQFFRHGVPFEEIQRQIEAEERDGEATAAPAGADASTSADSSTNTNVDAGASTDAGVPDAPFDATRVDHHAIKLDLMSDSWSHLSYGFVRDRARQLAGGLGRADRDAATPFRIPHHVLTTSGRAAERVFFQTFRGPKKRILQNIPFFTTLHNQVKAGFEPVEIPNPEIFAAASEQIFRGGVDLAELNRHLEAQPGDVAMTLIELCNNASGGYPVSLAQLQSVSEACARAGVPLVLDVTRIVKNAELIRRHEDGHQRDGLWEIVAELVRRADFIIGSLCKDFGVSAGGILGANDAKPIETARRYAEIEGAALDDVQAMVVGEAWRDLGYVEARVAAQLDLVRQIHRELAAAGAPVVQPGAGHCILLRADEMPGYAGRAHPRESFLRMLFERHGIRGGVHFTGGQRDRALGRCIRLAVPLGLGDERLAGYLARVLAPGGARPGEAPAEVVAWGAAAPKLEPEPDPAPKPRGSSGPPAARAPDPRGGDIAIVGLSGRYPHAANVAEYWENLKLGRNCITEVPPERWDWREHYHADPEEALKLHKSYGKWGGFLEGFDQFDPLFFSMAPRRVEFIDPQERLFLEECWRALEDAGYPPSALSPEVRGRTGVFGGMSKQGYNLYSAVQGTYPHTSLAAMVGRISHFFDLKGPSMPVDNHCASGLVAVHEACEYLRQQKGVLAIAGGVNLNLHPSSYLHLSLVQMLSRDARSAAFGKGGAGYVPGEGVGVVVLKRLEQAIEDGDHVYAVIRGSAVTSSGRTRFYGQPCPVQQAAAIRAALEQGGIDPRTVSYIEAAASGVESSDTVELSALAAVFGERVASEGRYAIGSVKPNIGHCEAVSGISQLTKAVLALAHGTLPPTVVPAALNPHVDFERLPFRLHGELAAWERVRVDGEEVPRRAGVTALGNGINAHVVVEEYAAAAVPAAGALGRGARRAPASAPRAIELGAAGDVLFTLSAQNKDRLRDYAARWIAFLGADVARDLASVAYTLQVGREPMVARLAIVASSQGALGQRLQRWLAGDQDGAAAHYGDKRTARRAPDGELLAAVEAGRLEELARLWAEGNSVPWPRLARASAVRHLGGLPEYPFARERYWINHT